MPNEEVIDVVSDSSTDDQTQSDDVAVTDTVTNDDVDIAPTDRPWRNYKAEQDRKFNELRGQLSELVGVINTLASRQAAPQSTVTPSTQSGQAAYVALGDEELAQRAAMGDAHAQLVLTDRIAARRVDESARVAQVQALVERQLNALYVRYPQLTNPSDPLTMNAMRAKAALLANGMANTRATDLEAIKLAIVDNPTLARTPSAPRSDTTAVINDQVRRNNVDSVSTVDGNTPRRTPAPRSNTPAVTLTKRELEIAKRMGVKDPVKAKQRFLERIEDGSVGVTPDVAYIVKEQS